MQLALICVLIAGLMPYLWTAVAKTAGPRYDNRDVRTWQSRLSGLAHRAHSAHLNSFEAFPLFAVAVLVAQLGNADPVRVNYLAMLFIAVRLFYGLAYLFNIATLRSLLWLGAFACSIGIFLSGI